MVKCLACTHLKKVDKVFSSCLAYFCKTTQRIYSETDVHADASCVHFEGYKSLEELIEAL